MSLPYPQKLLFTRPKGQGEDMRHDLQQAGWTCIVQPLLAICPFTEQHPQAFQAIKNHILNLCDFDVVISVSSNASALAVDWIDQYWPQMPVGISWYAVGASSAADLKTLQLDVSIPAHSHSEGILSLPDLQDMTDKRVLILRGKGGRELLAQTLQARGAQVSYAELYERQAIELPAGQLETLLTEQQIHYALLTSAEMVQQLAKQLPPSRLAQLHILVPSQRILLVAEQLGFMHCHVCPHINSQSILECLQTLAAQ